MTDYKRLSKRELLIALRERHAERKRVIAWLMAKAQSARERELPEAAQRFDQIALELGTVQHEPDVVEAARAKGITKLYQHVDKENARDHRAEHRKRRSRAESRVGPGAG